MVLHSWCVKPMCVKPICNNRKHHAGIDTILADDSVVEFLLRFQESFYPVTQG